MKRLHIVGGKNHGKTTLITDLLREFSQRGVAVGTIKHTHHQHELDVPGKDSHRHRMAGAKVVGIASPALSAVFVPTDGAEHNGEAFYTRFAPLYAKCELVLVEGDSHAAAPKLEVWRSELGATPLVTQNRSIAAIVTDDELPVAAPCLLRSDVSQIADWVYQRVLQLQGGREPEQV